MEASDETARGHHDPRRRAYHKSEDSQRTRAYNPASLLPRADEVIE
jgi:hypothetical protein